MTVRQRGRRAGCVPMSCDGTSFTARSSKRGHFDSKRPCRLHVDDRRGFRTTAVKCAGDATHPFMRAAKSAKRAFSNKASRIFPGGRVMANSRAR